MFQFKFNEQKALSVFLYISFTLIKRGIKPDIHKIFKIMYFADIKHMVGFGRPVVTDYYIAMPDGPVPSQVYDIVKSVRGDSAICAKGKYNQYFGIQGRYIVAPKANADMDELSQSDIECLNKALEENQHLTYNQLKKKSHDEAYKKATNKDSKISLGDMAQVHGASAAAIAYIRELAEIQMSTW